MLSRVRALASVFSARSRLGLNCGSELLHNASMSSRAYQTSRLLIPAKSRIALRYCVTVSSTTRSRSLAREAVVARGDQDARGEPLDVPLPRAGQRLVEVVDVEHQAPLGRGEHAEVGQVRVPAALHPQAGARRRGEIVRHDLRGAAVEGERRDEHPPVADRDELRDPRLRLALEQLNRIRAPSVGSKCACVERGTPGALPCRERSARPTTGVGPGAACDRLPHVDAAAGRRMVVKIS